MSESHFSGRDVRWIVIAPSDLWGFIEKKTHRVYFIRLTHAFAVIRSEALGSGRHERRGAPEDRKR